MLLQKEAEKRGGTCTRGGFGHTIGRPETRSSTTALFYTYTPNDDQMPGDRLLSRLFREFANRTTKPFDLTKVTTIEGEADNEKIHKQLGNGFQ